MEYLLFSFSLILPIAVTLFVFLLDKKTKVNQLSSLVKQVIIGIIFAIGSIISFEFLCNDITSQIKVINIYILISGLFFSAPSGIITGLFSSAFCGLSLLWNDSFIILSSLISAILTCVFVTICRLFLFENKKPTLIQTLIITISTEVLYMLLVFIINLSNVEQVFSLIEKAIIPLILSNGLSISLSLVFIDLLEGKKIFKKEKSIETIFQNLLLICVLGAFVITSACTFILQTRTSKDKTNDLLSQTILDVSEDIEEKVDNTMIKSLYESIESINLDNLEVLTTSYLLEKTNSLKISEINIINQHGIIVASSVNEYLNFDMNSNDQSKEFFTEVTKKEEYVQDFKAISYDENILFMYAGKKVSINKEDHYLQIGLSSDKYYSVLEEYVIGEATHRRIGQKGYVLILDENGNIVSTVEEHLNDEISLEANGNIEQNKTFSIKISDKDCFCQYQKVKGYFLVGVYPQVEAWFYRDIAVYIMTFMEVIVFASLYINVYVLLKKHVVKNIKSINNSLSKIVEGDLNQKVDVRENDEFISLSNDINTTVDTLKHYIKEAEERIDKELEFARQIQHSSLPSVFPPFPSRKDFDVFALMDAAKEVGGDFYDFYLLDRFNLVFLIADVSGKGIPSAMFMMRAKTLIKSLAESGKPVDEIFNEANIKLCDNNEAGMFITAWIGKLDIRTGRLTYVNAGHNPPLVYRRNGKFEYLRSKPNFVLAGLDITSYRINEIYLYPGDKIYLYTDGVTEAMNSKNELYGEKRLEDCLKKFEKEDPKNICLEVKNDVSKFVDGASQSDDITMLCVNVYAHQDKNRIMTFPDRDSLPIVLEYFATRLIDAGLSKKIVNRFQVAIDEIYSNIVNYSQATYAEIEYVNENNTLQITFKDNGISFDPTKQEEPDLTLSLEDKPIGGLGIHLVKKMAKEMNYERKNNENILVVRFDTMEGE